MYWITDLTCSLNNVKFCFSLGQCLTVFIWQQAPLMQRSDNFCCEKSAVALKEGRQNDQGISVRLHIKIWFTFKSVCVRKLHKVYDSVLIFPGQEISDWGWGCS